MTPYYEDGLVTLYHGDGREAFQTVGVVMTDPPYNVGYHYATYDDRLSDDDYMALLAQACRAPSVVIQYPEPMFRIAASIGVAPSKVVAWVYNANTPKQWRTVAWFGIAPDLSLVRQPYKNPTDRRVAALIASGKEGPPIYDWWHIDQVKNVSEEKVGHPCQVPLDLMARIVAVTPAETIIDPFAGSGTTLRAAKDAGRRAIGFEMDESYCEMAATRLSQEVLGFGPLDDGLGSRVRHREGGVAVLPTDAQTSDDVVLVSPGQSEPISWGWEGVADLVRDGDASLARTQGSLFLPMSAVGSAVGPDPDPTD